MKKLLALILSGLSLSCMASDYQSTLLVQTGQLRESDLIIRTISDLESNRICLAFYIRTTGTSPMISCYDGTSGFRSNVEQVAHYKEGKLIIRKIRDSVNGISCSVGLSTCRLAETELPQRLVQRVGGKKKPRVRRLVLDQDHLNPQHQILGNFRRRFSQLATHHLSSTASLFTKVGTTKSDGCLPNWDMKSEH